MSGADASQESMNPERWIPTIPPSLMDQEGLIDTKGIASLLGCTLEHATDRITKKPGFPKPRIELSQKMRRWDKDEVMAFLTTRRKKPRPQQ